jgi:hypothetical protein
MSERTRTMLLLSLLAVGVAFFLWTRHAADAGLLQGIRN